MSEELPSQQSRPRKVSSNETSDFERPGFDGHVYVPSEANEGFTVLGIDVHGSHPRKRMLGDTTRTYYVIKGTGSFTIGEDTHEVTEGDLFIIPPGGEYNYDGQMQLLEVNISPSNEFQDERL